MPPRPYQAALLRGIEDVWSEKGCPLAVLPTGGGKTFVFSTAIREHDAPAVAIAHRKELVGQISLALARLEVKHRIVGPQETVRSIVRKHEETIGRSWYSPNAPVGVAGVDSLRNADHRWTKKVSLSVFDEAHHVLRENKWGDAHRVFSNAKTLGVTATPRRADCKGLGLHADGIFTDLVLGPSMRDLINMGFLSDYRLIVSESNADLAGVEISRKTGDYVQGQLRSAMASSSIVGDVVREYLRYAAGKLGVTFTVGVASAEEIAKAFRAHGVPAEAVSAKTKASERDAAIRRFQRRETLQLVNVDLFGEGFDVPGIEVVSHARPTQSLNVWLQQAGRGLRPFEGKERAVLLDHAGNAIEPRGHGLPDKPRSWSLDGRKRMPRLLTSEALRPCANCCQPYPRIELKCPHCGWTPQPRQKSDPAQVDGDLVELDPEVLEALRAAEHEVNLSPEEYEANLIRKGCPAVGLKRNVRRHRQTQDAQARLRHLMDWWRGIQHSNGRSERECYRAFYLDFGVDVASARGLSAKKADELYEKIYKTLPFAVQCMTSAPLA